MYVRFEVLTAVKKKCRVFWDLEARAASIIRANQSSP
jgi:hypothetical protein